jgi:hypothetical protein
VRREDVGFFPFIDMRIDLVGDEFLQGSADLVVVGGKQHFVSSALGISNVLVMAGLAPAIYGLVTRQQERGCPGQARA